MPTRLQIAKPDIVGLFERSPQKVYSRGDLGVMKRQNADFWRLAQRTTMDDFVEFLLDKTKLRKVELRSEVYQRATTLYVWGDASEFELALSIRKGAYFSHGTAAFFRDLTEQIPRTIYVNKEQSPKPRPSGPLTQDSIDRAFHHKQRTSRYTLSYGNWQIVLLSGKWTGNLEVSETPLPDGTRAPVTNLERTLIDMVVRSEYAGGVYQVLSGFKRARTRLSINVLLATLKKLNYVYPYHQAIGFYMQSAAYDESRWSKLLRLGTKYDFYLTHDMKEVDYNSLWRLYIPKGFKPLDGIA